MLYLKKKKMAIIDLFSKRQKKLRGEYTDVYVYDKIPKELRVQIIQIIRETVGCRKTDTRHDSIGFYNAIHAVLCREYGVFNLSDEFSDNETSIVNFILNEYKIERVLDVVELFGKIAKTVVDDEYKKKINTKLSPNDAIEELNVRFKENHVGFQFDGGELIRVDSTYTHSEITKHAISLLCNKKFLGANEEYLKAHDHYKHGRNKESLTECLKALESTLKIICTEKEWAFNKNDTAKKLIQVCFINEIVPRYTQGQFTSLISLIESGVPTLRNKLGGHGQGTIPQNVDDEMTRYALNLTGSNIIFLVEQSGIK